MKKAELLSPAGNFESLKAAINNGADAVYLGAKNFSARAFADNFTDSEIVEAIRYAHLNLVKVYITVNTLLNEYEIENAYEACKFYYEHNVDGLLIQDLGLYYRLRNDFKDLELHASTQMHIHNLSGVKTAKELGFNRVVLARESSLELIKECCKEDIEVEVFVHGAICASYSGQCLLSSKTKGRSANKGLCAQNCRLKYLLYEDNKCVETNTDYLLSTKDMCLINDIDKSIEAGVSSLKIEGRMKSPAYVGYVTRIYRQAIDAYYKGFKYNISNNDLVSLKELYNRSFTNTYLLNNNEELFNNARPNHMGDLIGEVISYNYPTCKVLLSKSVNQFDGIRIISNNDTGLILNKLSVNNKLVSSASKGEIIEFACKDLVKKGDKVVKTLNNKLESDILNTPTRKIQIELSINLVYDQNITIKCYVKGHEFNYISDQIVEKSIKHPLTENDIYNCFKSTDNHKFVVTRIKTKLNKAYVYLKTLNDVRRDFYNKLDEFVVNMFKRNTYKELILNDLKSFKQEALIDFNDIKNLNDVINPDGIYYNDYNFVSEFGGLLLSGKKDGFYTLNISNSYAFEFLLRLGFEKVVLSSELKEEYVKALVDSFKQRCNLDVSPYVLFDYNRPLMYLNRDPFSNYLKNKNNVRLSDGINDLNVIYKNGHIELVEINDKAKPYLKLIK